MSERAAHSLQNSLPVVGLVALWLSVLNRLLYPSRHTFYHLSAQMTGFVQAVYAIAFALAALAILVAFRHPQRTLLERERAVAALGIAATVGVLLPVPFEDGTGMAIVAVVLGALLIAAYVSSHFMYWTARNDAQSARCAGLALAVSLVVFFAIDLVFSLANVHSIAVAAACPSISAACMLLVSAADRSLAAHATSMANDAGVSRSAPATATAYASNDTATDLRAAGENDEVTSLFDKLSAEFDLSKREVELAKLAYRNLSARKIAQELYIAESTVYTHLKRIYRKTGVHSKQELIDVIDSRR